jgi:AraC-like DNA-binding protein
MFRSMASGRTVVSHRALLASGTGSTSATEGGLRDIRLRVDSDWLELDTHMILGDGMTVVRGTSRARRDIDLITEHPSHFALHVGLRGTARPRVEATGRTLPSTAGDSILTFLPASGVSVGLDRDIRNEAFRVNFTKAYMLGLTDRYPELFGRTVNETGAILGERSHVMSMGPLLELIDDVMKSQAYGPVRRMFVEARLLELLARCLGSMPGPVRKKEDLSPRDVDRMTEARERLLARMATPPTLDQIARAVGTNEYKLKRHFKAVFGESVHAFLLRRRLEHAKNLLLETERAIKDIAAEVGYLHVAHFSAAFRHKYGVPPTALRQSIRKA